MADAAQAVINYLLADATVSTLTQARVYHSEIPTSQDTSMPSPTVVVRPQGGPGGFATLQLDDRRLALFCYGPTIPLADSLYEAVRLSLKGLTPSIWSATYIHWCKLASGGVGSRDPDLQWPYVLSLWLARVSDLVPA